jgi:hypothetical protein
MMLTGRLDDVPLQLDLVALRQQFRMEADSDDAGSLQTLVDGALRVARPKALYRIGTIDARSDDQVVIDGIPFSSRVLRVNLDQIQRVFAFVVTCGTELDTWRGGVEGFMETYWADAILEHALRTAIEALKAHLATHYDLRSPAMMNPGSLPDWPISQQRPLFDLVGQAAEIGVHLTDSYLMRPLKSVSGILFATDVTYENCQLCPVERCPNRRAPYDPTLFDRKYRLVD